MDALLLGVKLRAALLRRLDGRFSIVESFVVFGDVFVEDGDLLAGQGNVGIDRRSKVRPGGVDTILQRLGFLRLLLQRGLLFREIGTPSD